MRTRSASKRPAQDPPENLEGAYKATTSKSRQKLKGKLKVGLDQVCSVKACDFVDDTKERGEAGGNHEGVDPTEMDWEDGDIPVMERFSHELGKNVTVEFTDSPSSAEKRTSRRVSPEEKELAELVQKVHLLCLLARGRIVDKACNDPLIQASMLSLLPSNLLKITEVPNLTVSNLKPLVNWFHSNFQLSTESVDRGSFESNMRFALQNQKGTVEEVAALSVVLYRALNIATRFVSILDVTSLKADGSNKELHRLDTKAISSPVVNNAPITSLVESSSLETRVDTCSTPQRNKRLKKEIVPTPEKSNECTDGLRRKGDVEYEMQLQMALSATATATSSKTIVHGCGSPGDSSGNVKKLKGKSAIWSRNNPPLYWAEVYCRGETLNGRWIHVDAVNGIVDGEEKVEAAAAVCRRPLRYAIAFAGNGAKDVTRRYCLQWYKIAPCRINMQWWDRVMAPLKELESIATGQNSANIDATINPTVGHKQGNHSQISCTSNRSSLEDMELETRALTEPLPTNQLAYKSHHLYAIEKWLTKNQTLYPRGPVLGYCSGHPVYPRSCVQILQTRQKWLREGLQVKANQLPSKIMKQPKKVANSELSENSICDEEEQSEANLELYGKWQLETLQLPHAVNGIVPKNEHGNVEVWSEKCIPPGTVHLRLPRLVPVAKRLEIDFALALVGFEFRNGRTYPVFEGIVVCSEFKDAILEAYAEEEERREAAEKKRDEAQALNRWFQLLSSMSTRQRLKNTYEGPSLVNQVQEKTSNKKSCEVGTSEGEVKRPALTVFCNQEHEHVFPVEDQTFDENTSVRTKRCTCGFSIQVEEL